VLGASVGPEGDPAGGTFDAPQVRSTTEPHVYATGQHHLEELPILLGGVPS
jgi:hypothetical protein